MEESGDDKRGRVVYYNYDIYSPCYLLKEVVNSILKCLGLHHHESNSSSNKTTCQQNCLNQKHNFNNNINDEYQSSNSSSSSCSDINYIGDPTLTNPPASGVADPPPPTDPLIIVEDLRRGRVPPRPGVSGGRDPQTNSIPPTSSSSS
ncbi:hypothetical protein M9H77_31864 [Catharanthus roseus]|uniref:Uncharacterized protein n=1 Tax=Catharanthus roseus TaxID=4058 RepID=A0ACC0A3Z3_CATRO|nr:hypothetical protein M9H77_31864 [Catharanthus roseus]